MMWDWLFQFIEPLERGRIPYAIVGSVAASLYGEPRATNDVDTVIQLSPADAPKLIDAFAKSYAGIYGLLFASARPLTFAENRFDA
jgi:hypothetical protein